MCCVMCGHLYGRCHQTGDQKNCNERETENKAERRKRNRIYDVFRYVMVLYVWPSRGAHGQCALFFWSSSCLKSCAPVVIRSTRIGSRVETNAPSRAREPACRCARTHDRHPFFCTAAYHLHTCKHTLSLLRSPQSQFTRQTTRLAPSPPPDHPTRAGAPYAQQAPSRTCSTTHTHTHTHTYNKASA